MNEYQIGFLALGTVVLGGGLLYLENKEIKSLRKQTNLLEDIKKQDANFVEYKGELKG
jgi:hypothetical protein